MIWLRIGKNLLKYTAVGIFSTGLVACASTAAKQAQNLSAADDQNNTFTVEKTGMTFSQVQDAASKGDPDAQYALGYMYYYGKGASRDESEARFWINKAAAQGQPEAIKAQQLLGQGTAVAKNDVTKEPPVVVAANSNSDKDVGIAAEVTKETAKPAVAEKKPVKVALDQTTDANSDVAVENTVKTSAANNTQQIQQAPGNYYTVQLFGAYQKQQAIAFIDQYKLGSTASYHQTTHAGKPWYIVVNGVYKTQKEAQAAIANLPASLQAQHPWPKSIAAIQQGTTQVAAADDVESEQ